MLRRPYRPTPAFTCVFPRICESILHDRTWHVKLYRVPNFVLCALSDGSQDLDSWHIEYANQDAELVHRLLRRRLLGIRWAAVSQTSLDNSPTSW